MDLELQFEDMLFPSPTSSNYLPKMTIEDEMNLYLGFSPFDCEKTTSFEEDTDLKKKTSFKTETLETDNRSDSNFSGETINQKKSNHHNFQKHTVTALKDIIDEAQFENVCSNSSVLEGTKKIWVEFNKIKGKSILTKKFLSILFKSDKQSVSNLKQYGFKGLFNQFSEEQVQESKEELRKIVIQLLSDKSINDHVEKRSIQRKEEFRLYLINFREELKNSNIKKRISKESSDWINAHAEIYDWVL